MAVLHLTKPINKRDLQSVIKKLFEQKNQLHKSFNFQIPTFNHCNQVQIPLYEANTSSLKDYTFDLLNQKFHENECLIKFIIVNKEKTSTLIIIAHHIILDGVSMVNIINYIASNIKLTNKSSDLSSNNLRIKNLTPTKANKKLSNTRLEFLEVKNKETKKLHDFSTLNKTSIVSTLSACFVQAVKKEFSLEKLKIILPINLRGKRKDNNDISFLTGNISFSVDKAELLNTSDLSKHIENRKFRAIKNREYLLDLNISDFEAYENNLLNILSSNIPQIFISYLELSNFPNELETDAIFFSVSCDAYYKTKNAITFQVVKSNDKLFITLHSNSLFLTSKELKRLSSSVINIITSI